MAKPVKSTGRYAPFNRFYDFCWFVMQDSPSNADLAQIKHNADKVFEILGRGNVEIGRALLGGWKQEFQKEKHPTAQILLLDKWKAISDDQKKLLDEEIKIFAPRHMPQLR